MLTGSESGSYFGNSVAVVDDLDGDGVGELLVGSPGAAVNGNARSGKAYLFPGNAPTSSSSVADFEAGTYTGLRTFSGESDGQVTRKPVAGSSTSTSRMNSAAPFMTG